MADEVLSLREVNVKRGGIEILRGVSLTASSGEIVGIFGPSGAGKSTLFQAIFGEIPSQGNISLNGRDLRGLPLWKRARAGLGYIPQGPSVLFDLSVRENIATFAKLSRQPADPAEWAARVGLVPRLDVVASALSGGERRRLELARALLLRPSVLLCDEPFSGLNPAAISAISTLLMESARSGVCVLITDHHLPEVLVLAHRALLLLDGRIEVEEDAQQFAEHPLVQERYVGRT